jgi:probable DNA repair protein
LEACAWWCYQQLRANTDARLLVITQDLALHRGEIERAFLRFNPADRGQLFELSLGVPLNQNQLAHTALLLLRWLTGTLSETEVDWLFSAGAAASGDEAEALQRAMRRIRWRDLQRTEWTLEGFIKETAADAAALAKWIRRMQAGQQTLKGIARLQSHDQWADRIPHLLEILGWPGTQMQTSAGFQAMRRWQRSVDTAASLGFKGIGVSWQDFLAELQNIAAETLFAPESTDAPIQIAGPAESSGLMVDAVWFLGADEGAWPAVAPMHPFLPIGLQREVAMPHATPGRDWEFSFAVTKRLMGSARVVFFSCALQKDDVEARPSRLIRQIAGDALAMPHDLLPPAHGEPRAVEYIDPSTIRFDAGKVRGGAGVLSSQSQCPFQAFARARLAAQDWYAAEAGLSARQRGQILHDVLRSVWSGPPRGIRSHAELLDVKDLSEFIHHHVRKVMKNKVPQAVRDQMPRLYINLEEMRLIRLVSEWLEFEKSRLAFDVEETEVDRSISFPGLNVSLRLDRVDRLRDDSKLVIDYKTGSVDPRVWDLPRPDDVQLPLYKVFATQSIQPSLFESYNTVASGGLVFARVRIGECCFTGRVADACRTLKADFGSNSTIVKQRLTTVQEAEWKEYIEHLASDFVRGVAEVDPRDYPNTCERCGLQSLCRIQEEANRARFDMQESGEDDSADE